jgi:nucleoside-diphosphate-sugar epimerase
MMFALFGASGETGKELLKQSIEAGHSVRLLARTPSKLDKELVNLNVFHCEVDGDSTEIVEANDASVYIVKGDARNAMHVEAVISGLGLRCKCLNSSLETHITKPNPVDAVGSTLGSKSLTGPDTQIHSIGIKNIVQAMQKHSVERLVVESAIGTTLSWDSIPIWAKPASLIGAFILKEPQADKDIMEAHLLANKDSINYTIIRPPGLYNSSRRHPSPNSYPESSKKSVDSIESAQDGYGYRWGKSTFGVLVGRNDVAHLMLRCMSSNLASRQGVNIAYY